MFNRIILLTGLFYLPLGNAQEISPIGGEKVLKSFFVDDSNASEVLEYDAGNKASGLYYPPVNVSNLPLKVIGKGVKTKSGEEALNFACVGAPEPASIEPSCKYLRAVYYRLATHIALAFGKLYIVEGGDLISFFKSLRENWNQEGGPRIVQNEFLSFYSKDINNQKGWSWSESPSRIDYNRFLIMLEDIQGSYLYRFQDDPQQIFVHLIRPNHVGSSSPWMVRR